MQEDVLEALETHFLTINYEQFGVFHMGEFCFLFPLCEHLNLNLMTVVGLFGHFQSNLIKSPSTQS